jgi:hypothetical protein
VIRVTASKAGLLPVCQYAFRATTPWEYTTSRAADQGNAFHAAAAALVDPEIRASGMKGTKWLLDRLNQAATWLDAQDFNNRLEAEVAFAYDPATGAARILGKNIGRKYEQAGRKPHEVVGSADFLLAGGQPLHVFDWKTGRTVTEAVWPQMEMLGLMAARAHDVDCVVLRPLHVTDYGVEDSMVREMGPDELDALAIRIRRDVAAIEDSWPEPGPHCDADWCPARAKCVAYQMRKAG